MGGRALLLISLRNKYSNKNNKALIIDPAESKPIIEFLKKNNLILESLLITHHHSDHTSGIRSLLDSNSVKVYSPSSSIINTTNIVKDGDYINFNFIDFKIISTPGHTIDHIIYYSKKNNILFSGDTLFSLGCGRIFEGTYEQMFESLQKINELPNNTTVYCGHEYTIQNYNFLKSVFKNNNVLIDYKKTIDQKLESNKCSVPFNLGEEKIVNPFLVSNVSTYNNFKKSKKMNDLNFFKYIRKLKDNY